MATSSSTCANLTDDAQRIEDFDPNDRSPRAQAIEASDLSQTAVDEDLAAGHEAAI